MGKHLCWSLFLNKVYKQTFTNFHQNNCSENLQILKVCKFHKEAPVLESSLIKLQILGTVALLKRDSNAGFSCEVCQLSNITYIS